jgi:hypothetical protein
LHEFGPKRIVNRDPNSKQVHFSKGLKRSGYQMVWYSDAMGELDFYFIMVLGHLNTRILKMQRKIMLKPLS